MTEEKGSISSFYIKQSKERILLNAFAIILSQFRHGTSTTPTKVTAFEDFKQQSYFLRHQGHGSV